MQFLVIHDVPELPFDLENDHAAREKYLMDDWNKDPNLRHFAITSSGFEKARQDVFLLKFMADLLWGRMP